MSEGNSLINFGDPTKPVTTLIEKLSDAAGVLYEPYKIKRLAKAEAEADKIKTLAKIELNEEIEQRALKRFIAEETIKQQNVENIIEKALPELNEDAKPENIKNDWLLRFIEESKLVSDEEMQSLWSKILAGEANKPGAFSKRTIGFVSNLDKSDAELFTNLCGFCINKEFLCIYNPYTRIHGETGITPESLFYLASMGLVIFGRDMSFSEVISKEKTPFLEYFGTLIQIQTQYDSETEFTLWTGRAKLTKIGKELAPICGAVKLPKFLNYCLGQWRELGYKVSFSDKTESE